MSARAGTQEEAKVGRRADPSLRAGLRGVALAAMAAAFFACVGAAAQAPAAPSPAIPLCQGLTIVTAVSARDGDYESIKTVESLDSTRLRIKYSSETMSEDLFETKPTLKKSELYRTVQAADLESARLYWQTYLDKVTETIPGSTAIGASAAVLRDLKRKGEAAFGISNAYPGVELGADRRKRPNVYDYVTSGRLQRVDPTPARLRVLVNGEPADLPAVHARGSFLGDKVEFYFLDDEANPLALAFRIGIDPAKPAGAREVLRVTKIAFGCAAGVAAAPERALETALADSGKADVYAIYFTFGSDAIRSESDAALQAIADVLRRHPDWKLRIAGHTDAVGDAQYNVELSRRRATAVKDALVRRFGIDGGRLSTAGFGASQPKDSNDTLEGRARNRRVELARQP